MTVNTEPAVRQAIVDILSAIDPPIGVIWNRERTTLSSYRFGDDSHIQAWTVENGDPNGVRPESRQPLDTCSYAAYRFYTIRGYLTIDDVGDSSNAFSALARIVMNALTPHRSLGAGASITGQLPQMVLNASASIERNLVHYCEIVLETMSQEFVDAWQ